jgi:hypothetical protein
MNIRTHVSATLNKEKNKQRSSGNIEVAAAAGAGERKQVEHTYEHSYACLVYLEQKNAAAAELNLVLPLLVKNTRSGELEENKQKRNRNNVCTKIRTRVLGG